MVATTAISAVSADPAAEALSRLNELSKQAVQTREAVTAAQREADAKAADEAAAAERHRADQAALDAANAQLAPYQAAVDRIAAMNYMSGRDGQAAALLTADSPQQLIDKLSMQRTAGAGMAEQLATFHSLSARAATAAEASKKSAADAGAAAEKAAAQRALLQEKLKELLRKIAAAEAQYAALTPQQRAIVDSAPPPTAPPTAGLPGIPPGDVAPPPPVAVPQVPEALPVGVAAEAGLQPNTIVAARAVSQQFPQISDIDGVRPDSKPWHPSGLAIDIMIPDPESPEGIALGDAIRDFALANSARFGLQDVIWRGTYYTPDGPQSSGYGHYDHVHITTTPRG